MAGLGDAFSYAQHAGFVLNSEASMIIIAYDQCVKNFSMTQADFNAAWLKSSGGKNMSAYEGTTDAQKKCIQGLAKNTPVSNAVTSAVSSVTDAINPFTNVNMQRIVTGIFGGILIVIGLMMFIKQLTGVSITGVPGKVGKVLALA